MSRLPRTAVVALAAVTAALVNLALYGLGRAAGGTFRFTSPTGPAEVDAVTVAGFSAIPLLVGLSVVALLAPVTAWIARAALVVGPVLAVGTIVLMTLPTDFDTMSKVTLALCHVTLVPITLAAVVAIARRARSTIAVTAVPT
ncbi:DUF6069 family protein [Micromonospora siamensis]|uniref:Uncharacterized protein n=1 Tax=Micromonospora siamensis TaxID=299152 RepID=A0A1C5IDK0_9ACTN|nr:DUF6069 family protein [Micromonospora siamensis]SCG56528.1 hypothetical protein GA0074704_3278 [Micromonospora siamensis]